MVCGALVLAWLTAVVGRCLCNRTNMRKASLSEMKPAPLEDRHIESKTEASDSGVAPRSCLMCLCPLASCNLCFSLLWFYVCY